MLMLLIFPDGRLPSRRWWAVVAVSSAGYVLSFLGMWKVGIWVSIAALLASVAAVILRWRRSKDRERQQLKWLAYVVVLAAVAGLAGLAGVQLWAPAYVPAILLVVAGVGLGIPVAIGVAVLKHRLYDIDILINRTLVYGALTALLASAYLGSVLLLQLVLSPSSDLAIAGSTLAVAALFRPARARIQALVDRRFFRSRYDAQRTLDAFTARLRDEVSLDALSDELREVVTETMHPAHVSIWMRPQ